MMKKMLLVSAAILSLSVAQTTIANTTTVTTNKTSTTKSASHCGCAHMKAMVRKLNLSAAQQTKINAIKKQAKNSLHTNYQEMKSIHNQIDALIKTDKLNEAQLNSLINQKKDVMASLLKTRTVMKHQIYNTLNAAQKVKYSAMMNQPAHKHAPRTAGASHPKAKHSIA